eukprot:scaffold201_cov121-Isochrysis_galbana.AAC.15
MVPQGSNTRNNSWKSVTGCVTYGRQPWSSTCQIRTDKLGGQALLAARAQAIPGTCCRRGGFGGSHHVKRVIGEGKPLIFAEQRMLVLACVLERRIRATASVQLSQALKALPDGYPRVTIPHYFEHPSRIIGCETIRVDPAEHLRLCGRGLRKQPRRLSLRKTVICSLIKWRLGGIRLGPEHGVKNDEVS